MPIRGKGRCESCNKKIWGGTHCKKCTTGGGSTAGYRSIDKPAPTAAELRQEATRQRRLAQRSKAAAEREQRHKDAIARTAAEKAARRAAAQAKKKGQK